MRSIKPSKSVGGSAALLLLFYAGTMASAQTPPSAPAVSVQLRYAVVLDAAHGGNNLGALLAAGQDEKSFTLTLTDALDIRLRAAGINVILTRDSDIDLTGDARAESMNHAQAAACISIHATSSGNGVHLFTSAQSPLANSPANSAAPSSSSATSAPQRSFLPWQHEQAAYLNQSLRLESEINTALAHQQIPTLLGLATLMPLASAACPAIAIEIAPLRANTPVTDAKYQQKIVDALTAALLAWRADWRMQP